MCVSQALLIRVRVKFGLHAYAQVVDSKNVFSFREIKKMKIIEWIRPLREASLAGKHVRLYMGNEAGDLDSGKNDSF